jgi:hypothetical protein
MAESDRFQSLLDLLTSLARDIPELFRKELRLVKAEASEALDLLLTALGRLAAGAAVAVAAVGVLLAAAVSWTTTLLIARGLEPSLAGSVAATSVACLAAIVAWLLFVSAARRLRAAQASLDDGVSALTASAAAMTGGSNGEQ